MYVLATILPLIVLGRVETWKSYWIALLASLACLVLGSFFSFDGSCRSSGCADGIVSLFVVASLGLLFLVLIVIVAARKAYSVSREVNAAKAASDGPKPPSGRIFPDEDEVLRRE